MQSNTISSFTTATIDNKVNQYPLQLNKELNHQIHLLTLQDISSYYQTTLLIRLSHNYEKYETKQANVVVYLDQLFTHLKLLTC